MFYRKQLYGFLLLCLFMLATSAMAASQAWNGDSPANDDWSNGDNWVGDPAAADVPSSGDSATFGAGGPHLVTWDAAGPNTIASLDIQADTQITLSKPVSVGALTIANGVSLVVTGTGTLAALTHSLAGGSLIINSATATVGFLTPIDLSSLTSFTNNGKVSLAAGATLTTTNAIDVENLDFTGNVNVSGDIMSTGEVRLAGSSVIANGLNADTLTLESGSSLNCALASTITNTATFAGDANFASGLTMTGNSLSVAVGGQLSTSAGSDLVISDFFQFNIEVGETIQVGRDLVINMPTIFANQLNSALTSGAGQLSVGRDILVNASLLDTNNAGPGFNALHLLVEDGVRFADTAGINFTLDESIVTLNSAPATFAVAAPEAAFDGSVSIGRMVLRSTMNAGFPAGTDVALGGLTIESNANANFLDADLVLSGEFESTGAGVLTTVGGTLRAGEDLIGVSEITLDGFTVGNGETIGLSGQVTITGPLVVDNGGTLNLVGSHTSADVELAANQDLTVEVGGQVNLGRNGVNFPLTAPSVEVGGNVNMNGGRIDLGSADGNARFDVKGDLTVGNLLGATDATIDFFADGTASNGISHLYVDGDFLMATANSRMLLGEGIVYFGGNVDVSASEDSLGFAAGYIHGTSDEPGFIFRGGATHQLLTATGAGSYFAVTSLLDNSVVSHNGNIRAFGALNVGSAQVGVTTWNQMNGEVFVGEAAFPVEVVLHAQSANVTLGDITVREYTGMGASLSSSSLAIQGTAGANAEITTGAIVVEGDTFDNDGINAGDELNNGSIVHTNSTLTCEGLELRDGMALIGTSGRGAIFGGASSTLNIAGGDLVLGTGLAPDNAGSPRLIASTCTLVFSDTRSLLVSDFARFEMTDSTMTSATGASYTISSNANAGSFSVIRSNIMADSAGNLTLTVGGQVSPDSVGVHLDEANISNTDAMGMQVATGSEFSTFTDSTFSNAQNGGAHITFLGDATGDAGVRFFADFNTFDGSTVGGNFSNIANDAGNIVRVANDADNVSLTFRAPANAQSFGKDTLNADLTATLGEQDDNDGDDDNAPDNDVVWEYRVVLTQALSGSASRPQQADGIKDTAALFTLRADGGAINVTEINLRSDLTNIQNGGVITGAADSVLLFLDDGDTNDAFDAMDTILAMDNGATLAATGVSFDLSGTPLVVADQSVVRLGVALAFSIGSQGSFDFLLANSDLTVMDVDTQVAGTAQSFTVEAQAAHLTIASNVNNGVAGQSQTFIAQLENPNVLAFDMSNDANALSTTITSVSIDIIANPTTLSGAQIANFIQGMTLFSSVDTGLTTVYDPNAADLGVQDDDTVFASALGGDANLTFSIGATPTATITFTSLTGLVLNPGETRSFFLVLDPTNSAVVNAATSAGLTLRFRLSDPSADGAAMGIVSANGSADQVSIGMNQAPFVGEVFSRTWVVRNSVPLGGGGGSGCALSEPSSGLLMLFMLALLGVASAVRRKGLRNEH